MFEKWIDRILEKKGKVRELLHLGTEFEYTRTVDESDKIVDPFVPKFDITKVKNFSKEIKHSQKVRIESPRFIRTLRKALYEIFFDADKDRSGSLSYDEFKEAFKNLSYGLNDSDVYTLIALADENEDGRINWEEFIPIGIEVIKTFYARNKTLQDMDDTKRDIEKEVLASVYINEIDNAWKILEKEFFKQDLKKEGIVTVYQLRKVLGKTNLITPKEINALVRNIKDNKYQYTKFKDDLYSIRYELAKSRILENSLDFVQKTLVEECKKIDPSGKIDIPSLRYILLHSKFISLTPFQIHILLGQAEQDEERKVDYANFSFIIKEMVNNVFSFDSLSTAAELVKLGAVKQEDVEDTYISNLDLFKIFKKYDKNLNGFLELDEYMECLNDQNLNLSKQEVISLSLIADTNGDGQIDYEEFMKHFKEILHLVRFQTKLNQNSEEIMTKTREEGERKKKLELEKRHRDDLN